MDIKSLATKLEGLTLKKDKEAALKHYLQTLLENRHDPSINPKGGTISLGPQGSKESLESAAQKIANDKYQEQLHQLVERHGLNQTLVNWSVSAAQNVGYQPLNRLPCANVKPEEDWKCSNDGTRACSSCKLVSYCSKDCQVVHWRRHKIDCKDPIRLTNWEPAWVLEGRKWKEPTPGTAIPGWPSISMEELEFAFGLHIWGNTPATDTLNVKMNEGMSASNYDFNLGYVASGDLRNVVRTVNELPQDFSGQLTIILNDIEPIIVLRNALLLMILGTEESVAYATDTALHLWASTFVQTAHRITIMNAHINLYDGVMQDGVSHQCKLGQNSTLTLKASDPFLTTIASYMRSNLDVGKASSEYHRVRLVVPLFVQCTPLNNNDYIFRFEPVRRDKHDRKYLRLNPSHRLSFLEYRRFGIVLPFGAANNNFNSANHFLFSPEGRWLQDDHASPLQSWRSVAHVLLIMLKLLFAHAYCSHSIVDVIAAGKSHGAHDADLYGCLYFYMSEQLQSFAERIRKFRISFKMFNMDTRELAKNISSGLHAKDGMPKGFAFDRVDVSNIIDKGYVGIPSVLADWTPLLKRTNVHATIIGYSMNWAPNQPGGEPDERETLRIMKRLIAMNKISANFNMAHFPAYKQYILALYDNSEAFEEYLKRENTYEAAKEAGAKLKKKHTIVPHRIWAPLDGPSSALPHCPTDESWYFKDSASAIDVKNFHKIRADFELETLPDIKNVEGKQVYPSDAVQCSKRVLDFFLLLMLLYEKQKNQGISKEECPVPYGVSQRYANAETTIKTTLVVSSLPFFTDVEDPSTVDDTIPDVGIQDLDEQDMSQLLDNEAFTQKLHGNVAAQDGGSALDHGLTLDDLAKKSSRYELLKQKGYGSKKLRAPRVFDANSDLILPTEYDTKLRHETPVMVDVQMRVWEFEGNPHASSGSPIKRRQKAIKNGSRRYQLILNSMTLLAPCAPESPSKRKAESSASSHSRRAPAYPQSPTPFGSKRARH
ncbi:hypothetical protein CPC08DRAFT_824152 [Agrocybe pediades]|nr:hypothetical protein CPC08DRAFT_824152 [Agrocybe pediades]